MDRALQESRDNTFQSENNEFAFIFFRKCCPVLEQRLYPNKSHSNRNAHGLCTPVEQAEEIRLLFVQIMINVVKIMNVPEENWQREALRKEEIQSLASSLCNCCSTSALMDDYPDLRRECCVLMKVMCSTFPDVVRKHSRLLLTPLTGPSLTRPQQGKKSSENKMSSMNVCTSINCLLRHRHAKTRSLALDTVSMIISCHNGGKSSDITLADRSMIDLLSFQVVPNLKAMGPFEKSASVRTALSRTTSALIISTFEYYEIFVSASSSYSSHSVHELPMKAKVILSELLVLHLVCGSGTSEFTNMITVEPENSIVGILSFSMKLLARHCFDVLLRDLAQPQTVETRQRYLDTLHTSIQCIRNDTGNEKWAMDCGRGIVKILCASISNDEQIVWSSVNKCVQILAASVFCKIALDSILESIRNGGNVKDGIKHEHSTNALLVSSNLHCASVITFLALFLKGFSLVQDQDRNSMMESMIHAIGKALVAQSSPVFGYVHFPDDASALALLDLLYTVVQYVADSKANIKQTLPELLVCCIHLLARQSNDSSIIRDGAKDVLKNLALEQFNGESLSSASHLNALDLNFQMIFDLVTNDLKLDEKKYWIYGDTDLFAFDAMVRNCHPNTIGGNFTLIAPIIEAHMSDNSLTDHQTKLYFMSLLEAIVSDQLLPKHQVHGPCFETIILNAIVPNLTWKPGGMASSLRKLSLAVLFTVVRRCNHMFVSLSKCSPLLFPRLKSNLKDDDRTVREIAISTLGELFQNQKLEVEVVHNLYPDLIKLLDDSDRSVRCKACVTLKLFLACAPINHFQGTAIEYIVETLFIHLDDTDTLLQRKVYDTILSAISVNAEVVIRHSELSLSSHQSPKLCQMLLELALQK